MLLFGGSLVLGLELGRGFLSHGSRWDSLTDTDAKDYGAGEKA